LRPAVPGSLRSALMKLKIKGLDFERRLWNIGPAKVRIDLRI
jgi:hypothetical protein